MSKKTKAILLTVFAITLCYALIFFCFCYEVLKTPSEPTQTTHISFVVYDNNGNIVKSATGITAGTDEDGNAIFGFVNFSQALAAAKNGYTIKMVNDFEEGFENLTTTYGISNKSITLDINGYTWKSLCTSTTNGTILYQRIVLSGDKAKLNVIGGGTVITATSFLCMSKNGDIIIDPGEGNTLNFIASGGYAYESDGEGGYRQISTTFRGDPMLKIGHNGGNYAPSLTVRGNITYKTIGTQCHFIGAHEGSSVLLEDAVITADLSNALKKGVFAHVSLSKATDADGNYKNAQFWPDYEGPTFTIRNSVINSPYGRFFDLTNASETLSSAAIDSGLNATYKNADKIVIENSKINLNGGGNNTANDFIFGSDMFVDIRITGSEIVTDAESVFYFNTPNLMPNTVVLLKDTTIDTESYGGANQCIFNRGGTVIVDGGCLLMGDNDAKSPFMCGYTWTTKNEHDTANGALPAYADPDSELYDPTIAGYGHLIKIGTVVSHEFKAGEPGKLCTDSTAFAYEGNGKPTTMIANYKGSPAVKTVVSEETVNYTVGGATQSAIYTFEGAELGEYKDFTQNLFIDNAQFIVSNNGYSRTGLYNIEKSPTTDNKYLTHAHYYRKNASTHGAYISIKNATPPTVSGNELIPSGSKNITSYTHYALDLDLMSPNADIVDGTYIQFSYNSWGIEDGVRKSLLQSLVTLYLEGDASSVKIYTDTENKAEISFSAGKWTHLTLILELPTDENGTPDLSKLAETSIHVFADGEYATTFTEIFDAKYNYCADSEYYYGASLENTFIDEVRIGFPVSNEDNSFNGESTCFDNIILRSFEGNCASLLEIADFYTGFTPPENIDPKLVTIRWEDKDGNAIEEKVVTSYTRIYHPKLTGAEINGYFAAFECWTYNGAPIEETTLMPTEDMTFVKGTRLKANFDDVKYNLSLSEEPILYLYLPSSFVDGKVDGITFGSLSVEDKELSLSTKKYRIENAAYYRLELPIGLLELDEAFDVFINYTATYGEESFALTRGFKARALSFCEAVLSDESDIYSKAEKTETANFIRFANAFTYFKTKEYNPALSELYSSYKDCATACDTKILSGDNCYYAEISDCIEKIDLKIYDNTAQFIIRFKKSAKVNVSSLSMSNDDGTYELGIDEAKTQYFTSGEKKYCSVYATEEIDFSLLFGLMDISIKAGESEKMKIGSFDVGKWYESAELEATEKEAIAELLCSMKAFLVG